jgi:hypothetical protein
MSTSGGICGLLNLDYAQMHADEPIHLDMAPISASPITLGTPSRCRADLSLTNQPFVSTLHAYETYWKVVHATLGHVFQGLCSNTEEGSNIDDLKKKFKKRVDNLVATLVSDRKERQNVKMDLSEMVHAHAHSVCEALKTTMDYADVWINGSQDKDSLVARAIGDVDRDSVQQWALLHNQDSAPVYALGHRFESTESVKAHRMWDQRNMLRAIVAHQSVRDIHHHFVF